MYTWDHGAACLRLVGADAGRLLAFRPLSWVSARQCNMKDRPVRIVGRYVKAPTVGLKDRLTDGKSNSRSAGFCCKEGLENTALGFHIYAGSRILKSD